MKTEIKQQEVISTEKVEVQKTLKMIEVEGRVTSTGKRKTAVASLQYNQDKIHDFTINNKNWMDYFNQERLQLKVLEPFKVTTAPLINMKFKVTGGGISAQAEAVRHAISKLLKVLYAEDLDLIKQLKKNNLLTRNAKMVERKKPGQRKARAQFNCKKR